MKIGNKYRFNFIKSVSPNNFSKFINKIGTLVEIDCDHIEAELSMDFAPEFYFIESELVEVYGLII